MVQVGRKIYYDKATGNIIIEIAERFGDVVETTVEQDFAAYVVLAERIPETVGVILLPYSQDREKFAQYKYHVDIETGEIVWDLTEEQEAEVQAQATLEQRIVELENVVAQIVGVVTGEVMSDQVDLKGYLAVSQDA